MRKRRRHASIPTEIADVDGNLVRTSRKTKVRVFATTPLTPAAICEMGIPVCELDGPYGVRGPARRHGLCLNEYLCVDAMGLESLSGLHSAP